jgi:TetR/AcrR family transcriptional repressor of nem operon
MFNNIIKEREHLMPYSKEHKQKSRQRILESAAKLFTAGGFDNTSIDDIMAAAHMTRGAFYAHFANKSELYAQAMLFAAGNSLLGGPKPADLSEKTFVEKILRGYLSTAHIHREIPCPLAFLVTDVVNRDPLVRKTYTRIYKGMNKMLAKNAKVFSDCTQDTILAITALMIGGVAVGRALDDKKTTQELLSSCQRVAQALLES